MTQTVRLVNPINGYSNRVSVIKAIRCLTGLGLKEAKEASESIQPVLLPMRNADIHNGYPEAYLEEQMRVIRAEGGQIGPTVFRILDDLRTLGAEALKLGEDELANEILQLVLAEKLRRQP